MVVHFNEVHLARPILRLGVHLQRHPKCSFITVGFASFVLMIPLAVTSTQNDPAAWREKMGSSSPPHRSTVIGAVTHYLWLVRSDHLLSIGHAAAGGTSSASSTVWRSSPSEGFCVARHAGDTPLHDTPSYILLRNTETVSSAFPQNRAF